MLVFQHVARCTVVTVYIVSSAKHAEIRKTNLHVEVLPNSDPVGFNQAYVDLLHPERMAVVVGRHSGWGSRAQGKELGMSFGAGFVHVIHVVNI